MSAYDTAVLADSPLAYWAMNEASGTTMNDTSGHAHNGTFAAVTLAATGIGDGETAAAFNGTTGSASAAIDLSAQNKITLEFWLKWTTFADTDALAFEYSTNYNTANAFLVDPNSSTAPGGFFEFAQHSTSPSGTNPNRIARPSAGAWHYYALLFDQTASTVLAAYVDGAAASVTQISSGVVGGNFDSSTLYMMSRAGSSLFGTGSMAKVAIYSGLLTSTQVSNHFNAVSGGPNSRISSGFFAAA